MFDLDSKRNEQIRKSVSREFNAETVTNLLLVFELFSSLIRFLFDSSTRKF